MKTTPAPAVEDCLIDLFQSLGITQAHFAAGQMVPSDWTGIAGRYPERLASLTLVSPRLRPELQALSSRLLVLAGDQGPSAAGPARLLADLPDTASHLLRGYECLPWSDMMADRAGEVVPALLRFLDAHPVPSASLPEGEGEAGGITYRIRGSGPPLVLMPLDLAPAQWEPLIPALSARYCTITLGGPLVGVVATLYRPELAEMARRLALLGLNESEMADAFNVDVGALIEWKAPVLCSMRHHASVAGALPGGDNLKDGHCLRINGAFSLNPTWRHRTFYPCHGLIGRYSRKEKRIETNIEGHLCGFDIFSVYPDWALEISSHAGIKIWGLFENCYSRYAATCNGFKFIYTTKPSNVPHLENSARIFYRKW